ncbi:MULTISPECIES: hypothetical protein [Pandoraea]|uniref:hypothetical protein n=1 Tax=Pandoraea TaxID=93217 RepID=UPI001F5D5F72|nr:MULTISPECIES: hypothetical protein [Pandoraea]
MVANLLAQITQRLCQRLIVLARCSRRCIEFLFQVFERFFLCDTGGRQLLIVDIQNFAERRIEKKKQCIAIIFFQISLIIDCRQNGRFIFVYIFCKLPSYNQLLQIWRDRLNFVFNLGNSGISIDFPLGSRLGDCRRHRVHGHRSRRDYRRSGHADRGLTQDFRVLTNLLHSINLN